MALCNCLAQWTWKWANNAATWMVTLHTNPIANDNHAWLGTNLSDSQALVATCTCRLMLVVDTRILLIILGTYNFNRPTIVKVHYIIYNTESITWFLCFHKFIHKPAKGWLRYPDTKTWAQFEFMQLVCIPVLACANPREESRRQMMERNK